MTLRQPTSTRTDPLFHYSTLSRSTARPAPLPLARDRLLARHAGGHAAGGADGRHADQRPRARRHHPRGEQLRPAAASATGPLRHRRRDAMPFARAMMAVACLLGPAAGPAFAAEPAPPTASALPAPETSAPASTPHQPKHTPSPP